MKCNNLVALSLIVIGTCSCSVKEDRRECPCYLEVVPDSRMEDFDHGRVLLSVFDGSRTSFRDMFSQEQVELSDFGEISLRRGFVDVNALWGMFHGLVSGHRYLLPEGQQMDSLYSSTMRGVDATGELAVASIFDAKQFCTVFLSMVSSDGEYPYDIIVRGDVAGVDLLTLNPAHGLFYAWPSEISPSLFSVRVPRQDDGSLKLEFWKKGERDSASALSSFNLGDAIIAAGYDWTAESLQDIEMEIDFAHARISVCVNGWELTWAYSIEI